MKVTLKNYLENVKEIINEVTSGRIKPKEIQWVSRKILVELKDGKKIIVPAYNTFKLGPFNCSKATRVLAKELFNENYSPSSAWDRRYHCSEVIPVKNNDLTNYEKRLEPGCIIGTKVPNSSYSNGEDEKHLPRKYSHVVLYLGKDKDSNMLFADQYKTKIRVQKASELEKQNFKFKEILSLKKSLEKIV